MHRSATTNKSPFYRGVSSGHVSVICSTCYSQDLVCSLASSDGYAGTKSNNQQYFVDEPLNSAVSPVFDETGMNNAGAEQMLSSVAVPPA